MNAVPSLGRVTVFTCFHLILNEAAILNYACRADNPIKKGQEVEGHTGRHSGAIWTMSP